MTNPAPPASPFQLPPSPVEDPLAGLRDIHLPDAVGFWPLAPGWWMAAGLLCLLGLIIAFLEWRRRQTLAYKVTQELNAIAADTARYEDTRAVAVAASLLMRRILVTTPGTKASASLSGAGWERFLAQGRGALPAEMGRFLASAPYVPKDAPGADAVDRAALVSAIRRWIRGNA